MTKRWIIVVLLSCAGSMWMLAQEASVTPVHIVGLTYPRLGNLGQIEGKVVAECLVRKNGSVEEVRILSGHPLLALGLDRTLSKWRFGGCRADTSCSYRVSIVFVLTKEVRPIDQCQSDIEIDLPDTITVTSRRALAIID